MDKKALAHFEGKKVFIVLKDDPKPQVGILMFKEGSYFLTSRTGYLSAINPEAINRITSEELSEEYIAGIFSDIIRRSPTKK